MLVFSIVCAFGSFVCDSALVGTEAVVAGLVLVVAVSTGASMLSVDGLLSSVMSVLIQLALLIARCFELGSVRSFRFEKTVVGFLRILGLGLFFCLLL